MVRTYLLTEAQRERVRDYIKNRPRSMSQNLRALRHRFKQIDLEQMRRDLDLMEQLNNLSIKKGRKPKKGSRDQKAGFNVKGEPTMT